MKVMEASETGYVTRGVLLLTGRSKYQVKKEKKELEVMEASETGI